LVLSNIPFNVPAIKVSYAKKLYALPGSVVKLPVKYSVVVTVASLSDIVLLVLLPRPQ